METKIENNIYFNVAHWIKIDLRKQVNKRDNRTYYIVSKHVRNKTQTQSFWDYDMAKAYFIELIADYL